MKKFDLIGKDGRNAVKGGGYSLVITAVVLAILIVINLFASALPSAWTKQDISSSQLYSVTSNTKVVVNALQKDVTIYWIVQADKEDDIISNLLAKYDSLSSHISVVKKNPDVFPTFVKQYTSEDVPNNSLIVECGEKYRYISYNDIYLASSMYSYTYDSFDGEGAITSAIDYVISDELPKLYVLEGHGESDLPSTLAEQIEKENMEVVSFSLLSEESVPEEANAVLIYAPESDISQEEKDILADYLSAGGKLMVCAGPTQDGTLENLYGLLSTYGVEAVDGLVVTTDRGGYFQYPYILLPNVESSSMTDSLIEERYYVIMPLAQGLTVNDYSGSVTELLTTSDTAFSKSAGLNLTSFEWTEDDTEGPFALGVSVETDGGGQLVWFSSSNFLDDNYNAVSSGANVNLAMNALADMIGESEAMAIRSKSLSYNYLTISEAASSFLKVVMIGVFPLVYLGIGIYVVTRRRRLQNEPV